MTSNLYGYNAAHQRGVGKADVIVSVENVSGGDTIVTVGWVTIGSSGEQIGRIHDKGFIRLDAADRDRLIDTLALARNLDGGVR